MHILEQFINSNRYQLSLRLLRVLLLEKLGDGLQLYVAGTLVDSTDLAVAEHLLGDALTDEAHTTHPLNSGAGDTASDLGGIKLGHGGILNKVLASLLLTGGIIDKSACSCDLGVCLSDLVLHTLEVTNQLTKLATVVPHVSLFSSQ